MSQTLSLLSPLLTSPGFAFELVVSRAYITIIETNAVTSMCSQLPEHFARAGHTNNWAVLVDTSRFWFNYRHVANVLSIYRSVKRLGIPDRSVHDFQYLSYSMLMETS